METTEIGSRSDFALWAIQRASYHPRCCSAGNGRAFRRRAICTGSTLADSAGGSGKRGICVDIGYSVNRIKAPIKAPQPAPTRDVRTMPATMKPQNEPAMATSCEMVTEDRM